MDSVRHRLHFMLNFAAGLQFYLPQFSVKDNVGVVIFDNELSCPKTPNLIMSLFCLLNLVFLHVLYSSRCF